MSRRQRRQQVICGQKHLNCGILGIFIACAANFVNDSVILGRYCCRKRRVTGWSRVQQFFTVLAGGAFGGWIGGQ